MNTGGYNPDRREVDEMNAKEVSRLIDILKSFGLTYEQIEMVIDYISQTFNK